MATSGPHGHFECRLLDSELGTRLAAQHTAYGPFEGLQHSSPLYPHLPTPRPIHAAPGSRNG